jgi:hypothetical protein
MGDPTTGQVRLALSDGEERTLVFDFRALRIIEEITGKSFVDASREKVTALSLRALLYAGLYADALKRKGPWSLEIVEGLIDMSQMGHLAAAVSWALSVALRRVAGGIPDAGEMVASAATNSPNPGTGVGR